MISIVGLGPGDLDRVPGPVISVLLDPERIVVVRTAEHPAAIQLSHRREVVACDDLYDSLATFDEVYDAIVERVTELAATSPVVYAVPGSPLVGETAVRRLAGAGEVEIIPGESFIDAVLAAIGYDPLDRGLQILDAHGLPDPLVLDKPTMIAQLDRPEILADVMARLGRLLEEDASVIVMRNLGSPDASVVTCPPHDVDPSLAGYRTTLFIDADPGGLIGAVKTMRRLREECPWDMEQTHRSLVKNLVEETYELVEAISRLPEDEVDWVAYAEVEDELGDILLQVLFHEVIARQAGGFDIDDVAEVLRQKLVRRHPHVFGSAKVGSAAEVKENWDRIKASERDEAGGSALDGVPAGMPGLHRAAKIQNRAAKVGFDWDEAKQVLPKVVEEIEELGEAISNNGEVEAELGDVLFSVVNLARHLGVDPELALRGATVRFERRFRVMEQDGPLDGLSLDQLNDRWEQAKH